MIKKYIQTALQNARYEILADDGSFYGEIPVCNGVYANALTLEDCRWQLEEVLFEIFLVGINQKGSVEMQNYLVQANQTHRWTGMSKLPEGTITYQKITVIRK